MKQTSVIQVQLTLEQAVCYAELYEALSHHTLGITACVTVSMLKCKHSARARSVEVLYPVW